MRCHRASLSNLTRLVEGKEVFHVQAFSIFDAL